VSDIGLPDFSGVDLLKRLRSRGYAPPAVAVTAFATEDDRRRLLAGGFLAHVAKPVDPDRLVRSVAKAAATAARPTTG
jgi:CheY-like chemotaxis protein